MGAQASEIAYPFVRSTSSKVAALAYDFSRSTFNPGITAASWNIDTNAIDNVATVYAGTFSPSAAPCGAHPSDCELHRWVDYIDAISPLPNTSSFIFGAQAAVRGTYDPQRGIVYGTLSL